MVGNECEGFAVITTTLVSKTHQSNDKKKKIKLNTNDAIVIY